MLVIFCASALLFIEWTMPETRRSVVGNGAVEARGIWAIWWQFIRPTLTHKDQEAQEVSSGDLEKASRSSRGNDKINSRLSLGTNNDNVAAIPLIQDPNFGKAGRGKLLIPNPFPSVCLSFHRDMALILWLCATPYAVWYCIQTSILLIYRHDYGFDDLEVGLSFLADGGGVIVGGVIAGRLIDWSFKTSIGAGFTSDIKKGIGIDSFTIEEARTTTSIPIMLVSMFAVGGYGWAVHAHAHPAIPLILEFYVGVKCTVLHQIYRAFIVDISPSSPGIAGASNNICWCTLSAVLVAILQPAVKAIGYS
ncbi:hypothetical protein F5Y07DRAFT_202614 [Xylaria sp. FL0933]|nr:hypothetical protein F5Y07DRAFT_202614 [Xylaria sp. FL0933]